MCTAAPPFQTESAYAVLRIDFAAMRRFCPVTKKYWWDCPVQTKGHAGACPFVFSSFLLSGIGRNVSFHKKEPHRRMWFFLKYCDSPQMEKNYVVSSYRHRGERWNSLILYCSCRREMPKRLAVFSRLLLHFWRASWMVSGSRTTFCGLGLGR